MTIYLIILAAMALIFAVGLFLGDTDGYKETMNPNQIKGAMRGLQPGVRFWTALVLLTHAWTNPFVEGLVAVGVSNKQARHAGRFLAILSVASLFYGFWLLTNA